MQCKYCDKEGVYGFGWLDPKGEWRYKQVACDDHKHLILTQQEISISFQQLRSKWNRTI